jgi:hypothetical protein
MTLLLYRIRTRSGSFGLPSLVLNGFTKSRLSNFKCQVSLLYASKTSWTDDQIPEAEVPITSTSSLLEAAPSFSTFGITSGKLMTAFPFSVWPLWSFCINLMNCSNSASGLWITFSPPASLTPTGLFLLKDHLNLKVIRCSFLGCSRY